MAVPFAKGRVAVRGVQTAGYGRVEPVSLFVTATTAGD